MKNVPVQKRDTLPTLQRVENPTARQWYLQEAISHNWSVRALEREREHALQRLAQYKESKA